MPMAFAIVHQEGGVFGVSFPDFPGATTTARTPDAAIRKASEALSFHVAGMVEDGEPLPVLRTLDELNADREFQKSLKGAFLVMVDFELPTKAVRLNISMDENLLSAVDKAAKEAGQSRSTFLAEAARARIKAA